VEEDDRGKCVGKKVRIKLARMEQRDSTGQLVRKAENFQKVEASWSTPEKVTFLENGSIVSTANVSASQMTKAVNATQFYYNIDDLGYGKNLSANFTFLGYMIESNGTIFMGNQTINVTEGQFKFDLKVSNWTMGVNDTLTAGLFMHVLDKSDKEKEAKNDTALSETKDKKFKYLELDEGMVMVNPEKAIVDGVEKDIGVDIEVTNKTIEMKWTFPSFSESVHYDPTIGEGTEATTGGPNAAPKTPISAFVHILTTMAMMWIFRE
jgi:hypothetical protein